MEEEKNHSVIDSTEHLTLSEKDDDVIIFDNSISLEDNDDDINWIISNDGKEQEEKKHCCVFVFFHLFPKSKQQ